LSTNFTAFRLDTFAIASYSGAGQGSFMPGSILAHGVIDNLQITTPPPPVRDFQGALEAGTWVASFLSLSGWSYTLESSLNLRQWTAAPNAVLGTGERLNVSSPTPPGGTRFFRLNAQPQD
jgi:hypothetical protein